MFTSPFGMGPFTSTPTNTTVGPIGNKLPGEKEAVKPQKTTSTPVSFNTNIESLKSLATQPNLFAKEAQPTAEAEAGAAPMATPAFAPEFIPQYIPTIPPFGYNPMFASYPIALPTASASAQAVPAAMATRQIPFLPIQV